MYSDNCCINKVTKILDIYFCKLNTEVLKLNILYFNNASNHFLNMKSKDDSHPKFITHTILNYWIYDYMKYLLLAFLFYDEVVTILLMT